MIKLIKIWRKGKIKSCSCKNENQWTLLRFAPHLYYFFRSNKDKLPDFIGASAEVWKPIEHHVCNTIIDWNNQADRLRYFSTTKINS